MVRKHWAALDGRLVFDFTINRVPSDGEPSWVVVTCNCGEDQAQRLTITAQAAAFKLKFGACHVSGWLRQQTPVHIDGVENTAIAGDLHYGCLLYTSDAADE